LNGFCYENNFENKINPIVTELILHHPHSSQMTLFTIAMEFTLTGIIIVLISIITTEHISHAWVWNMVAIRLLELVLALLYLGSVGASVFKSLFQLLIQIVTTNSSSRRNTHEHNKEEAADLPADKVNASP
jgi:hypothetical protein